MDDQPYTWQDLSEHERWLKEQKASGFLRLTLRQKTILHSLVRGLSNRSIAAEQCITEDTVETDLRTLFHNFRAEDRTQLLFLAKEVFPEAFRDADGFLISGSATME